MRKQYFLLILALAFATSITGCVSEAGNKAIGELLKDPNSLETPQTPDEPIFNPNSQRLIEHTRDDEITERFENR